MKMILKNANVITMAENKVLNNCDVLIDKGKILKVGKNIGYDFAESTDCSGKYVIPGLIDMHVHLDAQSMLGFLFANGATTVRNMWGRPEILQWKKAIKNGEMAGPEIYTTGPLTDGTVIWEGCEVVKTPGEAERAVIKAVEDGYDYFKTYPDISRETFIKLMETAYREGIKVMGHGNNNVTTDELIDLGYYSIEHVSRLPQAQKDIIKLAKSPMWFAPTHFVLTKVDEYVCKRTDINFDMYDGYIGEKCKKEWLRATEVRRNDPRYEAFSLIKFVRMAKTFIDFSANIILGTDTVNPGVIPGISLHEELCQMVYSYGLEPFKALEMGTINAAKSLGKQETLGTLEVGKAADILILEGNPLEQIENSRKIFGVIKSGELFVRAKLDEMIERSKKLALNER